MKNFLLIKDKFHALNKKDKMLTILGCLVITIIVIEFVF